MSLVIVGIWGLGSFAPAYAIPAVVNITPLAVIAAAVTALTSFVSYLWGPQRALYPMALISYFLMATTTLTVIVSTGHTTSPFLALWMLVAVFAGLFGLVGVAPMTFIATGYLLYLVFEQSNTHPHYIVFGLAFYVPLVLSYLIWHKKTGHETSRDQAYSDLAHELSQVSSQSDIVINAIADGVIALNGRGTIELINPAGQTILGWTRQDALELDYKSVLKLTDSHDTPPQGDNDVVAKVLHTNQTASSDVLFATTSSGKKIMVSLVVSPVGAMGSGVIVVFRDITAAKAEEHQQAEFISTASHEMRTPVAAIEGYLGLALNPATAAIDEKARSYLTKAHESAQHLGRLFQDLLDVSKADDGRLSNNPGIIDMVGTIRDITNSLDPTAKAKNIMLLYSPDTGGHASDRLSPLFYTYLDVDHLREVVSNLIENAIKYTPAGNVTVDVSGDTAHVTVTVHDTGLGIPKEDIPHLFQKFYRVDNTDTREIGGTGLGLYLSRRLTETMGGRLWVESEYGKGSTFYVEFPRISNQEASERIEGVSPASERPLSEQSTTVTQKP